MQGTSRRCIIVEPFLTGFAGHSFTVCRSLKSSLEKQGLEVLILANRGASPEVLEALGALPVFCSDFIGGDTEFPAFIPAAFKKLWLAYRHGTADLKKGFPPERLRPGDIIFDYTMTTNWVLPFWQWTRQSPHRDSFRIVWQFFFPLAEAGAGFWPKLLFSRFYRRLFSGLAGGIKAGRILLCSDTEHRAAEYSRATGLDFAVLPMATESDSPVSPPAGSSKIRLSSLGPARIAKGIELISDLTIKLQDLLKSGRIELVIQANPQPEGDLRVIAAIEKLRKANLPNLELINDPLSPSKYQTALSGTGIMLLPYDPAIYGMARTSGVFAEAMAAGIPVVVPRFTWTAQQCERYNTGAVFTYGDASDFETAVRGLIENYREYKERSLAAAKSWNRDHGAEALAGIITGSKRVKTNRAEP